MSTPRKLGALVAAGALVFALSGIASAASVTPTTIDGNIGLPGQGGDQTAEADCLLADAVKLGNGNDSGTTANGVTVTQTYNSDTKETSFTATGGVVTIAYIKGGSAYNVYDYRPDGVSSDTGLVAPENASGAAAGLSHTVYCTSESEETTTTTTEETTTTTTTEETTTTTTFTQETGGETDVPTEPPTTTFGGGTSGPADGSWLLVLALGIFLASVVILTPAGAKSRS